MDKFKSCYMCNNARVDDELTDDNDLSYFSVGLCERGFRIMVSSGNGRPVEIIFEQWVRNEWRLVGVYCPSHCPNCGRELSEYRR